MSDLVSDPLEGLNEDYRQIIEQLRAIFVGVTRQRQGRATHTHGIAARGTAQIVAPPGFPASEFFAPGARYPIALRHSRASGSTDDCAQYDQGGASIKFFAPGGDPSGQGFHDILMNTGRAFPVNTARTFHAMVTTPPDARGDLVKSGILADDRVSESFRDSGSFGDFYYHSQIAYRYTPSGAETAHYIRFRLLPADRGPERGALDPAIRTEGRIGLPRREDDRRAPDHLRQELAARVRTRPPEYLLQAQLRPGTDESALDARQVWDEAFSPWTDLAHIVLDEVLDDASHARLEMSPARTHPCLELPRATSADDFASLGHVRALVYPGAAAVRRELVSPRPKLGAIDPPNQHALNVICRIKGDTPAEVKANSDRLQAIAPHLKPDSLNALGTVHFLRFVLMDRASLDGAAYYTKVGFLTSYDGDFERYARDFVEHASELFDLLLPLVDAPEGLVPVRRDPDAFLDFLRENGAGMICRMYSAYPEVTALQIRALAAQAGADVPPGTFDPDGHHMLNFVIRVKGQTPAEIKANSDRLERVVAALDVRPLDAVSSIHYGRFLLFDKVSDPDVGAYYTTFAGFTTYDGDFGRYVQDFVDHAFPLFDAVLGCVDAPADEIVPVRRNPQRFREFLDEVEARSFVRYYSNYPGLSMLQIRALQS